MRQKQKTTLRFISDIHIHAIHESEKKQILFSSSPLTILGYIQYKWHCTKRNAQVLCCKLQTWSFFPSLLSYSSALRFCLWQMEVHTRVGSRYNHSLDKGCLDILKEYSFDIQEDTLSLFSLTKIDMAYPALKFLLNIYKIMSCLFTVR